MEAGVIGNKQLSTAAFDELCRQHQQQGLLEWGNSMVLVQ